jgi:uncharacterized protein
MPRALRVAACLALLAAGTADLARAQPALERLVPPSPAPNGFIADGGPVLDAAARDRLNARIAEVQRATGGDIGVAILRDLADRAPVDVGVAIYRAWRVGRVDSLGSARRDLGALLLVVPKELAPSGRGECWVTTGLGAEGALTDATAASICRDSVIPHLRVRDYERAVGAGVGAIGAAFARATAGLAPPPSVGAAAAPEVTRVRERSGGRGAAVGIAVLLLGGGGVAGAVTVRARRRSRPRPCPQGHGMMVRLDEVADDAALDLGQRTEEQVGSVDYDVWACRVCAERLVVPYKRWSSYEGCPRCGYRTVKRETRTLRAATQLSEGVEEIRLECANAHCAWRDVTRRTVPRLPVPTASSGGGSSSGFGGGGGGGGGSSFGGSGRTSGGGGGSSY